MSPFVLFSQVQDKEPNILVYLHSEDIDSDLKDVISKSISLELGNSGFNVINIENNTEMATLMETAEWMGAFFILEGIYSIKEKIVSFDFNCYSVWDGETLISVSNKNSLSLSTDQYIESALAEIIPVIQDNLYIVEQIKLAAKAEQKQIQEEVIDQEPVITTEYIPDQKELDQQLFADNILVVEDPETSNDDKEILTETVSRKSPGPFTISAVIAPFVTTGEATEYFTQGVDISFFGGYRFTNSRAYLAPGIFAVMDHFTAEGESVSSNNFLLSAGPEIRGGISFNYITDIFFRFGFGGSVLMMNADNTGYRNMLIPSLTMGLGFNYYFMENLGVSISSNYSLFLESSMIISGFLPSVGVNYRFQGK